MSLSIALLNPREAIFVTDRRFADESGHVHDDEGSKLVLFYCPDARMAVTYTGLASFGKFSTHRWLLQSLLDAAKPDLQIRLTMDRLGQIATRDITKLGLPKASCRLSITLCGYYYAEPPPLGCVCRITNFEGDDGSAAPEARDGFSVTCVRQTRQAGPDFQGIWTSGVRGAVPPAGLLALQGLMATRRPAQALVWKAVEVIRSAASSTLSGGLIGQQCLSVIIPSDLRRKVLSGYHTSKLSYEMFMPSMVNAMSLQSMSCIGEFHLEAVSKTMSMIVPKVGRNQPCPCGSRKKYKNCHGRIERLHSRIQQA
jgi:SEC-C motif-containing protein